MSYLKDTISSPHKQPPDGIVHWLLAILEVVNVGGKLAPPKAIQKRQQELVDTYGSDTVWEGIKQFSMTFGIADAPSGEALFRSHPNLPSLLKTEKGQKAVSQWLNDNSAIVNQTHQLFCGLGTLVPPRTTSKFAEGEATPEQRENLGMISQILAKEGNSEESSNLHSS